MRKLLNTLFVTTPESYLRKDGLNVVISIKQQEVFRIPIINIESIVLFNYMGVSPGLMKLCCEEGVSITFLSPNGRFISRIQGPTHGNVLLRLAQIRCADNVEQSLHIARIMIAAKIQNYRSILQRFVRDYGDYTDISNAITELNVYKRKVLVSDNKELLVGYEGIASNIYFSVFPYLILQQKEDFIFSGRNKRPPKDPINAMLSFAYSLIATDTASALESVGLDPYVGFLHKIRPGRTSLALDLMEEFRAYLGDRLVLSLVNKRQITISDFLSQGEDSIVMKESAKKIFLKAWQSRKRDTIIHPYLNEKIEIGLLPYVQAKMLARFLRNDIDDYPVFLIK